MIVVTPRDIDFAGFPVRRSLPTRALRAIGPWVFVDHMGPHTFAPGVGVDVIPHPHINLATVTYLFDGEIIHRDSIGSVQPIRPGAINLMVAGRGIAHSERTGHDMRANGHLLHGLQLWHALPAEREEDEPLFLHYPAGDIPEISPVNDVVVRVLIGSAYDVTSPAQTYARTLYAVATIPPGATMAIPSTETELGVYCISGAVEWNEGSAAEGATALQIPEGVLVAAEGPDQDSAGTVTALTRSRVAIIGGEPLGRRYMWWNFVSSRIERIEQAKSEWRENAYGEVFDDTGERAPLPETDAHSRMKG